MSDDVFVEIECCQFTKTGQVACGDDYQILPLEQENRTIAVLSDGLGSGVKAHLLANMTTTMALAFLRSNMNMGQSIETMMDALPVCEVRKISYATFTMFDLRIGGKTQITEMGNPQYVHLRGLVEIPPAKQEQIISRNWPDRKVDSYELKIEPGDRIIICSDGVTQAGLGRPEYKFGWRRSGMMEFAKKMIDKEPRVSAKDLAHAIAFQALLINPEKCTDDISCLVIYLRHPRRLRILTGPPFHKEHDHDFAELAASGADKVIICGGTTANIVSRELRKKIAIDMKLVKAGGTLPPPGNMEDVGLVTEGILTLSKVCSSLENDEPDDVPLAAKAIINDMMENDLIEFIVGTKVNEAHQDPNLPLELELRRNIIKRLADILEKKYRKKVTIQYY